MMGWDIYGSPLRRGHCEVHPDVRESYPCARCLDETAHWSEQRDERDEAEYLQSMCKPHDFHPETVRPDADRGSCYCGKVTYKADGSPWTEEPPDAGEGR